MPATTGTTAKVTTLSALTDNEHFPGGPRLWKVDPSTLSKVEMVGDHSPGWWIEDVAANQSEIVFIGAKAAKGILGLVDRATHELTPIVDDRGFAALGVNLRSNFVDWWTLWDEPGTDPEGLDGFVIVHLDRLTAWQPTAHAKGASSQETAVVSTDGTILYLTGKELDWSEAVTHSYREVPLGIVAVEPRAMTEVARTDLPFDRLVVSPRGDTVLATGSWDDLIKGEFRLSSGDHLLDARTLEPLVAIEPTFLPYYQMAFSGDGRYAYAAEGPSTIIIDTNTLEVFEGPALERFNAELLELGYILDF